MNKRRQSGIESKLAVDIYALMDLLSVGRHTAEKFGEDAGAVIRIGKRKLYNVEKIKDYLDMKEEG